MKIVSAISPKVLAIAGILLASGSTALANNTIFLEVGPQYGEANPYQYGDGGEFTALVTGLTVPLKTGLPAGSEVPAGYSSLATYTIGGVTGFETFCVEDLVDFYVGQTYNYTLGTAIQQTSSVGHLSAGVAWLYQQFATGTLAGYNYTNAAARLTNAGQLQSAIWYLEGEPADGNVNFNQATDPFTIAAISHFGSLAAAQAAANPNLGVQVLELYNSSGIAQDQLIYVPDNGATAILLGCSLLALAAFKRRSKAA